MKTILSLLLAAMLCLAGTLPAMAQTVEPFTVVTSFYPLYIFAQNILLDVPGVKLQNLTHPSTGCLHDYQLLVQDMVSLSTADVLIINGGGMESFLPDVARQFPDLRVVDSSQGITLIPEQALMHDEEAHDEHVDEEHDEEAHAGHDHGEYNAHIWLDPKNAIRMSYTIAEALGEMLPDRAQHLADNAEAYAQRLGALDAELAQELSALNRRDIVTFHEAFPYFAQAYGLNVVAVLALEPDEALSPKTLAELVERVKAYDLPPLFSEPQYEDRAALAVAAETGAKVYELNPVVTGDGAPDAYERDMRQNAQVLLEALQN